MSTRKYLFIAVVLLILAMGETRSQDLVVMSVRGSVVLLQRGAEARPLERGVWLPEDGSVELGDGAVLQVMVRGGKLARFEGPGVRTVGAMLAEFQKDRNRPLSKAAANFWDKVRNLWRDERDQDSSGGTRGDRPFGVTARATDRQRNPPETEIALVAPRGGYVFADSVTLVWANGGALASQRASVLTEKLDTVFVADVMRPAVTVPRARLSRPAGSLYVWSVSTPGCNPDAAWFRCADQARARAIREQIAQAASLAQDDPATLHILLAQVYEDGEFYADACREYLDAVAADGTPAVRVLFEDYLTGRLGLSRKAVEEMYRGAVRGRH